MKNSGIGGQALMEGVMMRNGKDYACAVRKTDGNIEMMHGIHTGIGGSAKLRQIPFVRGPFIFLDSVKLGLSTLNWSSSLFMEEEEEEKTSAPEEKVSEEAAPSSGPAAEAGEESAETAVSAGKEDVAKEAKSDKASVGETALMGASILFALALSIGLFIVLPTVLVRLMKKWITSTALISLLEGIIRIVIFLLYLYLISLMKEIRRVFMYHGAEHKCINCVEHGLPLTVDNVRSSTRFHKRCGTSFILFTLIVSIFVGIFLPKAPVLLRIGCKLLALPIVMSLSYEFIRLAGSTENKIIAALSKPGLWLQRLTTKEPEDDMIEVGIASVEAVFDWKTWEEENF
ncbi:MAG: DUF1385 domain-containing protein [Lachnospiraceae bacterium]|nr:DUF1385 domain-containing protein [Lachnospiraceae bacterium]